MKGAGCKRRKNRGLTSRRAADLDIPHVPRAHMGLQEVPRGRRRTVGSFSHAYDVPRRPPNRAGLGHGCRRHGRQHIRVCPPKVIRQAVYEEVPKPLGDGRKRLMVNRKAPDDIPQGRLDLLSSGWPLRQVLQATDDLPKGLPGNVLSDLRRDDPPAAPEKPLVTTVSSIGVALLLPQTEEETTRGAPA
jgi:hypothetical protein